ncbi:hypothetical protein LLG96_11380 [bacterium]|nr:hypothetical protein [bacterium]
MGETPGPLDGFIISDSDATGFTLTGTPAYYRPESLWNHIDGGALPYLDYGVGDVMTYRGAYGPDSTVIVVDIYDMADSLGAFGIYSSERFPDYTYIDIGIEGYLAETALCFWKDRYYVKVFFAEEELSDTSLLEPFARAVDDRIPDGGGMPRDFSVFPTEYRLERTEAYIAKNVLGQEYLRNAFVVSYRRGDKEYQLFLINGENPEEAEKSFTAYRNFLNEYGEIDKTPVNIGDEAFTGRESWYGTIVAARTGKYILISAGLSDIDSVRAVFESMVTGLQ